MDFKAFKILVEKSKEDHPVWFGMESDKIPDESSFSDAERILGVELPSDYKDFVYEYGGGYFAFSNIYSLERGSDWNIIDANKKNDIIRNGHVLISENEVGDFFGFKVICGKCDSIIYYYDHETLIWKKTPYNNLFEYLERFALSR